jgi:hypothetical protein
MLSEFVGGAVVAAAVDKYGPGLLLLDTVR